MKIHFELGDIVFEYERNPMPEGRFRALCRLALATIAGGSRYHRGGGGAGTVWGLQGDGGNFQVNVVINM